MLGRAVGVGVGRLDGIPVGLAELGSSEGTAVGKELLAMLGRAVGDCVG
jgi:hypothetical protein